MGHARQARGLFLGTLLLMAAARTAQAQEEWWEGHTVERVVADRSTGWRNLRPKSYLEKLNCGWKKSDGRKYDLRKRDEDHKALYATAHFSKVAISVAAGSVDKTIVVTVEVTEEPEIKDVIFSGLNAIPLVQLRPKLTLNPDDRFNEFKLAMDSATIREELLTKGHYFSTVQHELAVTSQGVILHWQVSEGPVVGVKEIIFSGNKNIPDSKLKEFLLTRENSYFFFIPSGTNPLVRRFIEEDLKRIKLFYQLEGFLDIGDGDRVFVKDLVFNDAKTEVTIHIHIDEGVRYKVRSVTIKGNKIISTEEMQAWPLKLKAGDDYSDNIAQRDATYIRDKYGERAYILAEVNPIYTVDLTQPIVDVLFEIQENQEITVGQIRINGNTKTRLDVILRELKDFAPGDKFNNRLLSKGLTRLRDRGYFDPAGGLLMRLEPGLVPNERDIIIDVKEGQTGSIRFAGGYSSSFGITGLIELSQKNFDITDLPESVEDFFAGNAFAGGGQLMSIRLAPSAKRQSFSITFREPYLFGLEYGLGLSAYNTRTERESWTEARLGGRLTLDKRIELWRFELGYEAFRIRITDVDTDAPVTIASLAGTNVISRIAPSITFDARDSTLYPSHGVKVSLAYEHAGQWLGGDFDFWKAVFDIDAYYTILETDEKLKHVAQFHLTVGRTEPIGNSGVPFFELFYAGGIDSIRGFENRGTGPHENGDPIGGGGYMFISLEYSFPLLVEFLRGAVFHDLANIQREFEDIADGGWRQSIGFGIRFIIPQLGNVPVSLYFGFPLRKEDEDERETILFDIGRLFY